MHYVHLVLIVWLCTLQNIFKYISRIKIIRTFIVTCSYSKLKMVLFQMDQFYVENLSPGLYLDGLTSSHPISVPVHDPSEISSIFDAISYQKVSFIFIWINNCVKDYLTEYFLPLKSICCYILFKLKFIIKQSEPKKNMSNFREKNYFSNFLNVHLFQGASIIRMFMGLSGEEPFKQGLQEYLERYKYQNAEGVDLWEMLQKVC
jgi:hypothetical protein